MLKNRYQEIVVGMNLISLIRGLISSRKNQSVLLIDDPRFVAESYHFNYLSEMEIRALLRLGKICDIAELNNLKQFLIPAKFEFITDKYHLRLGRSPIENIKELIRKFPDLLDADDLDLIYKESPESFNQIFLDELARYELNCYESSKKKKNVKFELQGPQWLRTIYQRFSLQINSEYTSSKDLKYASLLQLLGISSEEKLKIVLSSDELTFYFFRLLSPIYCLHGLYLLTQLKRRLLISGGDYTESGIQYWQFHNNKFENLLLASFEGVISGNRVLFFAHLPEDVPFKINSEFPIFRKNKMIPVRRVSSSILASHLCFITENERLGSEIPYRVIAQGDQGPLFYHWPYPDMPGSKSEFYAHKVAEFYELDTHRVSCPSVRGQCVGIQGVCLDLREVRQISKSDEHILSRIPLEVTDQGKRIQGLEYWGPFCYRSHGLLALCYGIEEF